eukprot:1085481-Amorphochlora_amoeboformis.AAC.1
MPTLVPLRVLRWRSIYRLYSVTQGDVIFLPCHTETDRGKARWSKCTGTPSRHDIARDGAPSRRFGA